MIYEFICPKCQRHFATEQPMVAEHRALCVKCGVEARRIYTPIGHYWNNPKPLFHKDGSYEEKY